MTKMFNGMDIEELNNDINMLKQNPTYCQISQKMTGEWIGGIRSKITAGNKELFLNGDEEFSSMAATQASLVACEIGVIATHATLRGIELERIFFESEGQFNVARPYTVDNEPDPGFQNLNYTVKIKAKNATPEQLTQLLKLCETHSPVADSLERKVPIKLKFEIE